MNDPMHAAPHDMPIEVLVDGEWITAEWSEVAGGWYEDTNPVPHPTGWRFPGTEFDRGRERYYSAMCRAEWCDGGVRGRSLDGGAIDWRHDMKIIDNDHEAVGPVDDVEDWSVESIEARRAKLAAEPVPTEPPPIPLDVVGYLVIEDDGHGFDVFLGNAGILPTLEAANQYAVDRLGRTERPRRVQVCALVPVTPITERKVVHRLHPLTRRTEP